MGKELLLGAFEEFLPNFISNTWHHPRSNTRDFATLPYWQRLVGAVEKAGFDFFFLAEAIGYPMDSEGRVPSAVVREAVQFPTHDPLTLMPAIAATVPRIALVCTASTTAQTPLLNARTFTTLDHISEGRISWNIVTSDHQHALVRILGLRDVTPHDERYARADEFVQLNLQLWEGGWEDDAIKYDKEAKVFFDPEKVHRICFDGKYFNFDGFFQAIPSLQRTPTLFQAGTSKAGVAFAAKYAECVFTQDHDADRLKDTVIRLRAAVVEAGRPSDSLKIINCASFVVASTDVEATRVRQELWDSVTRESVAALFLGWAGVDLSALDPEDTLDNVSTDVGQTLLALRLNADGSSPTIGEVLDRLPSTMAGLSFTGTPQSIADEVERVVDLTDIDGFLVENIYSGGVEGYLDFIEQVMPELRRRGLLPNEPRTGSAREILTGAGGPQLPEWHPGVHYRHNASRGQSSGF